MINSDRESIDEIHQKNMQLIADGIKKLERKIFLLSMGFKIEDENEGSKKKNSDHN